MLVFFYSLGNEYANLFLGDGNLTGSPQSLEKRRQRAGLVVCGAVEMTNHVMCKMFKCDDLAVISNLLINLKCLHKICLFFARKVTSPNVGHRIDYKSTYTPDYLQSVQMDCFSLAAEIGFLLGKLKPYVNSFEEENNVIQLTRIALVISRYLQDFVLVNSAFHAQHPPVFKKSRKCRSVWQY